MIHTLRLLFTALLTIGLTVSTSNADAPRQFKDLQEATAVLDQCLAAHSRPQLLKIVASSEGHFAKEPALFEALMREWQRTGPFSALYADRKFPTLGGSFKLGGHDKELGHLHIDFKRATDGWVLDDIWMCR